MKTFPVVIENKKYSEDFQTLSEYSKGWRTVLRRARESGSNVLCNCRPIEDGQRKLSVKYIHATDNYHVARFPGTESLHDPECRFSTAYESSENEALAETIDAVRNREGGTDVFFYHGIGTTKKSQLTDNGTAVKAPRANQLRARSLDLLSLIWEHAGLNVWLEAFEGKRNNVTVFYRIGAASENIKVNNIQLSSILLLQTTQNNEASSGNNAKITKNAIENRNKLFVIAKLARFNAEKHSPRPANLPLAGFFGMPWINVSTELWERTGLSFKDACMEWETGTEVVAIALIDPKHSGSADAVEIALMPVTERFLPKL